MKELNELHLGKQTEYVSNYAPELLTPIPRSLGRDELGIDSGFSTALPFVGADLWTAYEISWLDGLGKPQVGVGEFTIPATSGALIESKSFKLYLNSFNQTRFEHWSEVAQRLEADLSQCAGGPVVVQLYTLGNYQKRGVQLLPGDCIDGLEVEIDTYQPDPSLLDLVNTGEVTECLHSHLLKTNCPVTGQPDWASVMVRYRGRGICRKGLLKYIVSFREQQDFHEQCVERIFNDILARCGPEELDVYARYTRRGGLDINPWRSTTTAVPPSLRLARQ